MYIDENGKEVFIADVDIEDDIYIKDDFEDTIEFKVPLNGGNDE